MLATTLFLGLHLQDIIKQALQWFGNKLAVIEFMNANNSFTYNAYN